MLPLIPLALGIAKLAGLAYGAYKLSETTAVAVSGKSLDPLLPPVQEPFLVEGQELAPPPYLFLASEAGILQQVQRLEARKAEVLRMVTTRSSKDRAWSVWQAADKEAAQIAARSPDFRNILVRASQRARKHRQALQAQGIVFPD